jgi:hypothetical protein
MVSGCGGGGSSSDSGDTSAGASSITISGTTATGAALTGATVTAKCASGTGTTTQASGSDGSYTVTITGGTLPCVLEATDGTTTLHSVATTTTAQITPLTELLVAQLTGMDPATYMSSVNTSTLAATVTSSAISTAQTAVLAVLNDAGVDTSAITNLVTGSITAGSGSDYDGVLDNLATTLAEADTELSDLTTTVASSSSANTSTTTSSSDDGSSAIAADLLLKPAAGTCTSLRATNYWAVFTSRTGGTAVQKFKVSIDTANSNSASVTFYTSADSSTLEGTTYTLTANGTCRFTSSAGDDITVSPSGIVAGRSADNEAFVALPVQTHTLAEMAGNWNMIGGDTDDTNGNGWTYGYATTVISTDGYQQISRGCWFDSTTTSTCAAIGDDFLALQRPFAVASDGSFTTSSANNDTDGGPWADRMFVYKTGKGDYFAISANIATPDTNGDGSVSYATKVRTLSLPSVGATSSNWNIAYNWTTGLVPSTLDSVSHTVTAIDDATSSFTRLTGSAGGATHAETILINDPYDGFSFRDYASGVATSDNSTTTVRKVFSLKGGSAGITIGLQPYQDSSKPAKIVISIAQPAS